jgi:tRNA(fMet)-specific endonuclease VapC
MILLDTDHFSVLADGRHSRHGPLVERLGSVDDSVLIPVVSVAEQLQAWLAQIHRVRDAAKQVYPYERLIRLIDVLGQWDIARWNEDAATEFARLRRAGIRVGTQDLKIASIALTNDALLLSANLRDFQRVPGLRVEDWLYG